MLIYLFSEIQFLSIAKKLLNIQKENCFTQQKLSVSKTSFGQADGQGIISSLVDELASNISTLGKPIRYGYEVTY